MSAPVEEAVVSPSQTSEASPRHVLVVDDDALTLKLTVARLKAAGYRVTAVRSAAEALAQSIQEPPDVIFSDVLMGETDGFGFCRRVRGTPAIAHVPVVLASAHYWDEKAHALAESVGASTLVGRSPDFDVELKALDEAVRRGRAPRARATAEVYEEHLRTNADQISRLLDEAREAEGRYRALFENANEAIAVMNASGVILEANERWRYILGVEPRSLVGRHLLDFTRHGRETFRPELDAAIERGTGRVYGVPVARADDATVYVDFSISVVKVGDRRLIFAIGRDVTGRFLAAQALALAEEKYRSLVERLPDVVMTTSGDRWLFVTNNVEQITGFTPAEIFAMDRRAWLARVHPDDEPRFDAAVESYLEHGITRPLNVEYRFRHKDGRFIWFWHRVTATYERNGVSHSDSLVSDVTERKKLEESLRQAQKMEAIGQLTGGIAHDFNNILATILANSEFLLSELGLNDPRATEVSEIKLAAERAALLTRQLLAFSRKQVLELRATDLNRLITQTERMLRRLIGEDIELSVVLEAERGTTLADSGQIEQVLLNLVVNARDAMPRGGLLQIQTSNVSVDVGDDDRHGVLRPGKYVMIAVSDSGVGMDRETQSRIFEPFFTTKDAGRGTGLGLATCHGIVNQLGGQIVVYSELGLGTVFKVYLPVAEGTPAPESPPSVAPPANGETVLLVEDDLSLRSAIERMLASRGYRVLVAKDAEDALELAERHRGEISVILTDVVMPRMSGPELVDRARLSTGDVKALFMSGYTDHALLRGGLVTQRFHFIQKPFTLHALSTKLQEVLA